MKHPVAERILILKMGDTLPSLKARRGDFEHWVMAGMGRSAADVSVIDVQAGQPLPSRDGHAGIVITGSHSMVTDRLEWSERAADWLRQAMSAGTPILGICYGHQLLAHALGGTVGNNPNGREFGTVEILLEDAAKGDELMGGLPPRLRVHVGHTQSVLGLPAGAVRLASNPWDANQAVRFGAAAWGVQFHPEFDEEIVREYVEHYRGVLSAEGQDPDHLVGAAGEEGTGSLLLRRFADLAEAGA